MQGRILARLLAALIALAGPVCAAAQESPTPTKGREGELREIETDRDSFTPATSLAPEQRLIFESAWSFIDNRTVPDTNSFPEIVTRYGVNDWLELRLGWNWEAGGAPNTISGGIGELGEPTEQSVEFESQIFYGFKAALSEQDRWIPESAIIVQAGTPVTGSDPASQLFTTYVLGWELANHWEWDSAIRYGLDSVAGDHFNVWAPSTVLKVPLGERWKAHAEYFAICSDGTVSDAQQHYFSPGIHYLITKDIEVGLRVGWGMNPDAANFFSNVGLGWQF